MHPHHALQQLLIKIDADVSAATIHGIWCGRLAAGDQFTSSDWWIFTQRLLGEEVVYEDNMVAAFKAVAKFADQHLQSDSFEFEPWLPADNSDCSDRLAALAEWCQGFIEGLISVLGKRLAATSEDTREVVKDLLDIGEVDSTVSGTEEDEKQFRELAEYVKVAALNVWHDIAGQSDKKEAGPEASPTIH